MARAAALGLGLAAALGSAAAALGPTKCKCRANGRAYDLGERACIDTPDGPRQARCRLVQNVTSWSVEESGCTVSSLAPASGQGAGG